MTPTLLGRWQIRIFLLSTVGLFISLLIGVIIRIIRPDTDMIPVLLLGLSIVLVVGCILDILYQYIQSFRWDADWPTTFQVAAGVLEGLLVWFLMQIISNPPPNLGVFLWQYGSIWLIMFVLVQGPLRLFWPRWRYQGGEWLRSPAPRPQRAPSRLPAVPPQVQTPYLTRSPSPPNVPSPLPAQPIQQKPKGF